MSLLRQYLSDAQRVDLDKNYAFNVTTPAGNTWRVLLARPGGINLIDPDEVGRCVFTMGANYEANALAMLLLLQSRTVPEILVAVRARDYLEHDLPENITSGEEYVDYVGCHDDPPGCWGMPTDPHILEIYK